MSNENSWGEIVGGLALAALTIGGVAVAVAVEDEERETRRTQALRARERLNRDAEQALVRIERAGLREQRQLRARVDAAYLEEIRAASQRRVERNLLRNATDRLIQYGGGDGYWQAEEDRARRAYARACEDHAEALLEAERLRRQYHSVLAYT